MNSPTYRYRQVTIASQWFIEIHGLEPADEAELEEMLASLQTIHGWPVERQVIVGAEGGKGEVVQLGRTV